jgi:4-aminobutyrate aminotransferase-like enzyme
MEAPDLYRGPVGCAHVAPGEAYAAMVDPLIADLQSQTHGVSIAIIDSAFMTNGILDAPAGYVHGVAERVRKAGGLFIADEVQSGFGRMGTHMWGHQHHGVIPDFVTIGKPAGNGYPVGAIITRAEILESFIAETGPFFSTFGGGNAACAAGLAVLDVMDSEGLLSNSLETGNYFRAGVRDLMGRFELIGDVRGSGLATGIELVGDRKSKKPVPRETRDVINRLKDQGVLVGSDGKLGNVLKIRPPLVFSREHADFALSALARVMQALG